MKVDSKDRIEVLISEHKVEEAETFCKSLIQSDASSVDDSEFWFLYGKILWQNEKRAEAEIAFRQSVSLNPDSSAKVALQLCEEVSSFFNPDLLNP